MISLAMMISIDNVEHYGNYSANVSRCTVKLTLFHTYGSPIGFYVHHAYSTTLVELQKQSTISPTILQIAGLRVLLIIL